MSLLTSILIKLGILGEDLDYYFIRASMVLVFRFLVTRSVS
jgi:hypothetical protein